MNILALDTATHTGWAVQSGSQIVGSGSMDFSIRTKATKTQMADHPGMRFFNFDHWVRDLILKYKPDIIAYEMVVGGRNAGGNTSLIQKGLEATVIKRAYQHDMIPVWTFAAATIKKFATGNGVLTHESKIQMVDTARVAFPDQTFLPHRPSKSQPWLWDDNQCDALWILALAVACARRAAVDGVTIDEYAPNLTSLAHLVTTDKWTKNLTSKSRRQ